MVRFVQLCHQIYLHGARSQVLGLENTNSKTIQRCVYITGVCVHYTGPATTRTSTYNFKNLAVGSLIWGPKTGVNSSYFPQKFSTCPVLCCILTLSRLGLLGASVNKNKCIFLVDLVAHFLKLYVGCMRKWSVAMKIAASEIGF
jgi:hypothetical protein